MYTLLSDFYVNFIVTGLLFTHHCPDMFWHEYAKIPAHTSQNSIAVGNLEWVSVMSTTAERSEQ